MKKHFHIHIKANTGFMSKIGKDPHVDWFTILLVSTISAIVFIYFSVTLFLYINNDANRLSTEGDGSAVSGTLDKSDLVKLIADFQDKKSRTALFQNGYQGVADPSGTSTFVR